jgi:hypothetical protein
MRPEQVVKVKKGYTKLFIDECAKTTLLINGYNEDPAGSKQLNKY